MSDIVWGEWQTDDEYDDILKGHPRAINWRQEDLVTIILHGQPEDYFIALDQLGNAVGYAEAERRWHAALDKAMSVRSGRPVEDMPPIDPHPWS